MRELITLSIGGAGVAIGEVLWRLWCVEHGIGADGLRAPSSHGCAADDCGYSTVFHEHNAGGGSTRVVPRAVLIDTDTDTLNRGMTYGRTHTRTRSLGC